MSKIKELKIKGFVTYKDGKSTYTIGSTGEPVWEKRIWDIYIPDRDGTTDNRYLTTILEEFGTHNDVEIIIRRVVNEEEK